MAYQPHSFMFQPHEEDRHRHHHLHIASNPNSNLFHGEATGVMMMKRSLSFDGGDRDRDRDEVSDEEGSQSTMMGEMMMVKKKRLSIEQVKTLEKSFEVGNKLEPDRKLQLANALGLQPRQVAIWFQNRRARWKTKQLEKDYDVLRKQFDLVKADNDSLHAQNKKLHAQLSALKGSDLCEARRESHNKKDHQGDQGSWSNGSDQNSSENNINLEISRAQQVVMNNNNTTTNNTSSASSQLAQVQAKNLFPSNLRPSSITQILQGSSRSHLDHHQILQSEENFCNMLVNGGSTVAVESDNHQATTGFWPWPPEQHYFH